MYMYTFVPRESWEEVDPTLHSAFSTTERYVGSLRFGLAFSS